MDWHSLRTDTTFCDGAEPGPLARELGDKLAAIPGWFTIDDCMHFALVLKMQSAFGLRGDLVEIGTYHGRSAAVLSRFLAPGEKLVLCDWFDRNGSEAYQPPATPELLRKNLALVNPRLDDAQLELHDGPSEELRITRPIRFAHVDGGHTEAETIADLRRVAVPLVSRGVIAVDDYHHRDFPEVTPAVDRFLAERNDFRVLADLNRHGAVGRKLYLLRS